MPVDSVQTMSVSRKVQLRLHRSPTVHTLLLLVSIFLGYAALEKHTVWLVLGFNGDPWLVLPIDKSVRWAARARCVVMLAWLSLTAATRPVQ